MASLRALWSRIGQCRVLRYTASSTAWGPVMWAHGSVTVDPSLPRGTFHNNRRSSSQSKGSEVPRLNTDGGGRAPASGLQHTPQQVSIAVSLAEEGLQTHRPPLLNERPMVVLVLQGFPETAQDRLRGPSGHRNLQESLRHSSLQASFRQCTALGQEIVIRTPVQMLTQQVCSTVVIQLSDAHPQLGTRFLQQL